MTGDKEETAVNISFSAGHFPPGLNTLRLTKMTNLRSTVDAVNGLINQIEAERKSDANYAFGLVVDGQTLNYCLTVSFQ